MLEMRSIVVGFKGGFIFIGCIACEISHLKWEISSYKVQWVISCYRLCCVRNNSLEVEDFLL